MVKIGCRGSCKRTRIESSKVWHNEVYQMSPTAKVVRLQINNTVALSYLISEEDRGLGLTTRFFRI